MKEIHSNKIALGIYVSVKLLLSYFLRFKMNSTEVCKANNIKNDPMVINIKLKFPRKGVQLPVRSQNSTNQPVSSVFNHALKLLKSHTTIMIKF